MQKETQSKAIYDEESATLEDSNATVGIASSPYLIPGSILMGSIIISLSILFSGTGVQRINGGGGVANNEDGVAQVNEEDLALNSRDVILGDPDAPVTLIEYGDYQCPFCARFFSQTEQHIKENYVSQGLVRMVFRNFQFLGPESVAAAEAAECAKDQGKFWAFHDAIYTEEFFDGVEHNGNLNRDLFTRIAGDLNMDLDQFTSCVDSGQYSDQIQRDRSEAQLVGVNSTPITFINGKRIEGAVPTEIFVREIEEALSRAGN